MFGGLLAYTVILVLQLSKYEVTTYSVETQTHSTLRNVTINPHNGTFVEGIGLASGEVLDPMFGTF